MTNLWTLFGDEWDWQAAAYPEQATETGDRRFDDRLTDWSLSAILQRHQHERDVLKQAEAFDRASLASDDQLNLDLFLYAMRTEVEGFRFPGELLQLNQLDSPASELGELARAIPRGQREGSRELSPPRLKAVPAQVDQQIALLTQGAKMGVTPPQVTLSEVPKLLANHIPADPAQSPLYLTVFADLPATIPDPDKARLPDRGQGRSSPDQAYLRPTASLQAFAQTEYVPKARTTLAASDLPDGKAWYAHDVAVQTTSDKTPDEIHAVGLAEVDRIEKEMDEAQQRKPDSRATERPSSSFLKKDKRFFYPTKRSAPRRLPRHREAHRPRAPAALQDPAAADLRRLAHARLPGQDFSPAAFYEPGAPRRWAAPGTFMANTYDLKSRPKWRPWRT